MDQKAKFLTDSDIKAQVTLLLRERAKGTPQAGIS